jgi:hypothetical protein
VQYETEILRPPVLSSRLSVTKADDHASRIERMRRLCSALDSAHEQTQNVCRRITAEARQAAADAKHKRGHHSSRRKP